MQFAYRRTYVGPLQAVILDWAGTTVDYGSRAPVAAITKGFRRRGIEVTPEQVREPMGKHKREHIRLVAGMPQVSHQWREAYGHDPSESEVDQIFEEFVPLQIEVLPRFADPIPGVPEVVAALRDRGLKIGSSTGYTREMMDTLEPAAAERGYRADTIVCASEVPQGRPYPWMCYVNAVRLGVYPMAAVVKIGDTITDVEAGLNAGAWTIALARCGNELGLTEQEQRALPGAELATRLQSIRQRFRRAGAHYVLDYLADCEPILDDIEDRLAHGEGP